jgi:hypothetical protein
MSERVNPIGLHRRMTDQPEEDFRKARHYDEREVIVERQQDTYTKWIVGIVGAGIISLLGILGLRDRQSIDQTMIHLNARQSTTDSVVQRHETDIVRLETLVNRVPEDIAAMRGEIRETNEKLDRVLIELRRQR